MFFLKKSVRNKLFCVYVFIKNTFELNIFYIFVEFTSQKMRKGRVGVKNFFCFLFIFF